MRMDRFLPQCVGRFEVNQDMMFIKDPPEFLRYSRDVGIDDVVMVSLHLLSVCSGSFGKGSVWVATGFKCSLDVLLFLLFTLGLSGHDLSLMV